MTEPAPRPTRGALAAAFLTIALASFGGGLSAWAQRVLVERRRWLDEDEFLSALTLCRLLPGPNQVNMAVYVGAKFRGLSGALATLGGLVVVPAAILLALGAAYFRYRQLPALDAALRGAVAAAAAMTLAMGLKVGAPLLRDPGASSSPWRPSWPCTSCAGRWYPWWPSWGRWACSGRGPERRRSRLRRERGCPGPARDPLRIALARLARRGQHRTARDAPLKPSTRSTGSRTASSPTSSRWRRRHRARARSS